MPIFANGGRIVHVEASVVDGKLMLTEDAGETSPRRRAADRRQPTKRDDRIDRGGTGTTAGPRQVSYTTRKRSAKASSSAVANDDDEAAKRRKTTTTKTKNTTTTKKKKKTTAPGSLVSDVSVSPEAVLVAIEKDPPGRQRRVHNNRAAAASAATARDDDNDNKRRANTRASTRANTRAAAAAAAAERKTTAGRRRNDDGSASASEDGDDDVAAPAASSDAAPPTGGGGEEAGAKTAAAEGTTTNQNHRPNNSTNLGILKAMNQAATSSKLGPNDLTFGLRTSAGYQSFFRIVLKHREEYIRSDKEGRVVVYNRVIDEWKKRSPPGRFWAYDRTEQKWVVPSEVVVSERVRKLLREWKVRQERAAAAAKREGDNFKAAYSSKEATTTLLSIAPKTDRSVDPANKSTSSGADQAAQKYDASKTAKTLTADTESSESLAPVRPPDKPAPMKTFKDRLNELRAYKKRHGHCNVPKSQGPLGQWVNHQRTYYRRWKDGKPAALTDKRREALEELGFEWVRASPAAPVRPFHEWMTELRSFKAKNGHCNVPKRLGRLGHFVERQRKQYKRWKAGKPTALTDERRRALEDLGFEFVRYKQPTTAAAAKGSSTAASDDGGSTTTTPRQQQPLSVTPFGVLGTRIQAIERERRRRRAEAAEVTPESITFDLPVADDPGLTQRKVTIPRSADRTVGFGFDIEGWDGRFYVSALDAAGPAANIHLTEAGAPKAAAVGEGTIRVGDEIRAVHGLDVSRWSRGQVSAAIKATPLGTPLSLLLLRRAEEPSDDGAGTDGAPDAQDGKLEAARSLMCLFDPSRKDMESSEDAAAPTSECKHDDIDGNETMNTTPHDQAGTDDISISDDMEISCGINDELDWLWSVVEQRERDFDWLWTVVMRLRSLVRNGRSAAPKCDSGKQSPTHSVKDNVELEGRSALPEDSADTTVCITDDAEGTERPSEAEKNDCGAESHRGGPNNEGEREQLQSAVPTEKKRFQESEERLDQLKKESGANVAEAVAIYEQRIQALKERYEGEIRLHKAKAQEARDLLDTARACSHCKNKASDDRGYDAAKTPDCGPGNDSCAAPVMVVETQQALPEKSSVEAGSSASSKEQINESSSAKVNKSMAKHQPLASPALCSSSDSSSASSVLEDINETTERSVSPDNVERLSETNENAVPCCSSEERDKTSNEATVKTHARKCDERDTSNRKSEVVDSQPTEKFSGENTPREGSSGRCKCSNQKGCQKCSGCPDIKRGAGSTRLRKRSRKAMEMDISEGSNVLAHPSSSQSKRGDADSRQEQAPKSKETVKEVVSCMEEPSSGRLRNSRSDNSGSVVLRSNEGKRSKASARSPVKPERRLLTSSKDGFRLPKNTEAHDPGTRVYACWIKDGEEFSGHWYPGVVVRHKIARTGPNKGKRVYHVKFDDGDESTSLEDFLVIEHQQYLASAKKPSKRRRLLK